MRSTAMALSSNMTSTARPSWASPGIPLWDPTAHSPCRGAGGPSIEATAGMCKDAPGQAYAGMEPRAHPTMAMSGGRELSHHPTLADWSDLASRVRDAPAWARPDVSHGSAFQSAGSSYPMPCDHDSLGTGAFPHHAPASQGVNILNLITTCCQARCFGILGNS